MADIVAFTGTVDFTNVFKSLFQLPEKNLKTIVRGAARLAAPEVLTAHYERNKDSWDPPTEQYAKRPDKQGKGQLELTGRMLQGIKAKKVPASLRKVAVAKNKKVPNTYRISVGLRKMVNGKNVYAFAQYGRATGAKVVGRYGGVRTISIKELNSTKKGSLQSAEVSRKARRMVSRNEPGDEHYFTKHIQTAFEAWWKRTVKRHGGR